MKTNIVNRFQVKKASPTKAKIANIVADLPEEPAKSKIISYPKLKLKHAIEVKDNPVRSIAEMAASRIEQRHAARVLTPDSIGTIRPSFDIIPR